MKLIIIILLLGVGCASTSETYDLLYEHEATARKSITKEDSLPPKETCGKSLTDINVIGKLKG